MTLLEKMGHAAEAVGCEDEIKAADDVIRNLSAGNTAGIAVLGEENCGKTALMNKLAGQEVRKTTVLSMNEPPLMVIFGSGEEKPGFETAEVQAGQMAADVTIYEIPLSMAVDGTTGNILPMLEEMDAVIYVVSAIMPLTSTDFANIEAIADKFPLLIYISKMDLLENDEERGNCAAYVKNGMKEHFGVAIAEVFESGALAEDIFERFSDFPLEEIRQFHIMRIEALAKETVIKKLQLQLDSLDDLQKEREAEQEQKNVQDRLRQLKWDEFRVEMMEREQAAAAAADQKTAAAAKMAEKKLAGQFEQAQHKEEWINHMFQDALRYELKKAAESVMEDVSDMAQADAAWLASEVKRRMGVQLTVNTGGSGKGMQFTMDTGGRKGVQPAVDSDGRDLKVYAQKPRYHKLAAAGTGLIAGGALLGSMTLIPACMVAVPASIVSYYFIKGSVRDKEEYHRELLSQVKKCCEKNFSGLTKEMHPLIHKSYERMTEDIRRFGILKIVQDDFADIRQQREELYGVLEELNKMS